jgi:hypothetical protein
MIQAEYPFKKCRENHKVLYDELTNKTISIYIEVVLDQ